MESNILTEKPSPLRCPEKYCFFWNQDMNQNGTSGYCEYLFGYCTRLDLFQGDRDYYEPNGPELEKSNLPEFYFIKNLDILSDEAREELENEYNKYFINCPERWVNVKIKWLRDSTKRREKFRKNGNYSTASRFSGMKEDEAWSIYANFVDDIDDEWSKFGLCFLFDNAPHFLLKKGNSFELYENGVIGIGEVL